MTEDRTLTDEGFVAGLTAVVPRIESASPPLHRYAPSGPRQTDDGWREFCTVCDLWEDEPGFNEFHIAVASAAADLPMPPRGVARGYEPTQESPGAAPGVPPATVDGFVVPAGWTAGRVGRCRSCHAAVMWTTTPAGKASPIDADGTSHFATCPQADQWRRR